MDNLDIDIQIESTHEGIPSPEKFIQWAHVALEQKGEAEITIRVVDEAESAHLNNIYRKKEGPTNVLSFPFDVTFDSVLHGDIVICAPIVCKEAKDQNKLPTDHFAHLTVHGILHLQGYDHVKDEEANVMEQKEISILSLLGIPNPYE